MAGKSYQFDGAADIGQGTSSAWSREVASIVQLTHDPSGRRTDGLRVSSGMRSLHVLAGANAGWRIGVPIVVRSLLFVDLAGHSGGWDRAWIFRGQKFSRPPHPLAGDSDP